ncbi:hypothetical protein [Paenibacillus polymyxa]|uniref:hypothetical protein n=1 Tax=Paenibacillus polymyxa TaxID=1406 RepID=UPI00202442CF|nr:hypothetical protein [Paenibacillus polymyxa]URJ60918.1 hypothetical protein MF622_000585 [Paenibacillus polymyxa]
MEVNFYFNEAKEIGWPHPEIRAYLTLANNTGTDIFIQVTKDVDDGNWGPNKVNSTKEPQVKSKKLHDLDATFTISVWKNDDNRQGKYIGSFDHTVEINALGNYDRLEFIIKDDFMFALSWKKVIEILIGPN